MAAEAVIALRAVDATKAAFSSVQSSLNKLNATSATVGKTLKTMMMGGLSKSFIRTLDSMGDKLEKIISKGEDIGFGQSIEDAMRLKQIIDGFFKLLLVIPSILAKIGIGIKDFVTQASPEEIAAQIEQIKFSRIKDELKGLNEEAGKLTDQIDALGKSEEQLGNEAKRAMQALAEQMDQLDPSKADDALKIAKLNVEYLQAQLLAKKTDLSLDEKLAKAKEKYGLADAKGSLTLGEKAEKLAALKEEYSILNGVQMGNIAVTSLDDQAKEKQIKTYERLAEIKTQMAALDEEVYANARAAGNIIAQGFEDAVIAGGNLRDMLKGVAQDLLRLFFRQQVTAPLAAGLGDFFSKLTGKAVGGPVSANTPYVVGEKGPELFIPRGTSGTIIPNHQMGNASMSPVGGGINITYNIASGVSRAELAPLLEQERKRLKAEIPDMVRRGGAYRAAFA